MKRTILATLSLVATSQLLLTKPAGAITFNFSWRSDAPELTVLGGGPVHTAMGTVDINAQPRQTFTISDVSNIDITVTDGTNILTLGDSVFNLWDGIIDGDGQSASTLTIWLNKSIFFGGIDPEVLSFGCLHDNCAFTIRDMIRHEARIQYPGGSMISINADSQAALQNSFQLTAVPFDIPYYLSIILLGGVVGVEQLKKWKNKKKEFAKKDEELKKETQEGQGL